MSILACTPVLAADNPEQVVRSTTDRVLQLINSNLDSYESNPAAFYAIVKDIALPHFDLPSMAHRAIGDANWRAASTAQRNAFTTEFGNLMVRTYGAILLQYRGQKISFPPVSADSGVVVVNMLVEHPGGRPPSDVRYSFRRAGADWRIVEVTIDGVSIVTNNSLYFRETIRRYGIDSLTETLRRQNADAR
jgi:phospholipid transport system substrate-binding protein